MTQAQDTQQAALAQRQRRTTHRGKQQATRHPLSATTSLSSHPEPRTEQERQQRERAERRERALLWTDDRPFSIWKE